MGDPVSFRRPSFRSASHGDPGARPAAPSRKTKRAAWWDAARGLGLVLVAAPLAVFTAILLHDGLPSLRATPQNAQAVAEVQALLALVQEQAERLYKVMPEVMEQPLVAEMILWML